MIRLTVKLEAKSPVQDITLFLNGSHPGLLLNNNRMAEGNFGFGSTELLKDTELQTNNSLEVNVTFRVQSFVLPQAQLYFSFRLTYSVFSHGTNLVFKQTLNFFDEFQSADLASGNLSLSLPYYEEQDHVESTFPPHVGDLFFIEILITLPCVSTELNIIPTFMSNNFTSFFVNITGK